MSEEPIKPNPSPEQYAALQEELQKLKANNAKLLDQNIKAKEAGKAIPPDVDVNALIAYKQKKNKKNLKHRVNMKRQEKNLRLNIEKLKRLKTKGYKSLSKDRENLKWKPLLSVH